MKRRTRPAAVEAAGASPSELLLFGGPMRYDGGFVRHEDAGAQAGLWTVVRQIPGMLRLAWQLAWQADRAALAGVVLAEVGRAGAGALSLVAVNAALGHLLSSAGASGALHAVLPSVLVAGAATGAGAVFAVVSSWGADRLSPRIQRTATLALLERAQRVEMASLEDPEFNRLLESARFGINSVHRLTTESVAVLGTLLSMAATGGVLFTLSPVLLPLLVLIAAPRAWGAAVTARRRRNSVMAWLQHLRASQLIAQLLTQTWTAAEIRVHGVGAFLLHHFEQMALASDAEQARLASAGARTKLAAAAASGLAYAATFCLLGVLVSGGHLALAAAGTAVVAVRTGAVNVGGLLSSVNQLFEEALYVGDLQKLATEAEKLAIPAGGADLPERPAAIHVEDVSFTYAGRTAPSLDKVNLVVPTGKIVALVGDNGAGKSTLARLLCGLYRPDSGTIRWDGVDTATANRAQQFASTVLLPQDAFHWPLTLRAIVTAGRPGHHDDARALAAAAEFAGMESLLREQDRGWDTLAARGFEGGVEFSGGQRQRIGTARTHLRATTAGPDGRRPFLVVADEPTSALDPAAEVRAFDNLRRLAEQGATVVLITHRLAACSSADLIYVLKDGRLVEQGTHEQLMAAEPDPDGQRPGAGGYRTAYLLQARQYAAHLPGPRHQPSCPADRDETSRT
ncbi:ATP-binding cassette domain-containing protein [Kitasatospora sp. NPDC088134]|uniref:ATP-binding cassette domain-containing protein n=1 Tax=Kitasatospora sp. NPDC088134 TaxID=3364071 RepID=UPI0038039FA0